MAEPSAQVERARACVGARAWREAREWFLAADASVPLELDDLEDLALAAYLSGAHTLAAAMWQRALQHAAELGDVRRAARQAVRVGADLAFRGEFAPAMGWFARAGTLLDGCPPCAEQAWLGAFTAIGQMFGGDAAGAAPRLAEAAAAGRRFADRDLVTIAGVGHGQCLIMQGDLTAGLALLDEVMVGVVCGEVFPLYAGIAYCATIATCWGIFDVRRAREWTVALERWCAEQPDLVPFRGNCLIHRSELLTLAGRWEEARDAAVAAVEQLSGPTAWHSLGAAYYQLAELDRLRGDAAAADEAYRRAADAGRSPEPGLALLRLAADLARLDGPARNRTGRAGLSAREVEVLRLLVEGLTNRAIASTLAISEKTVARHVSNIFAKIDVNSRAGATAYAYEHRVV